MNAPKGFLTQKQLAQLKCKFSVSEAELINLFQENVVSAELFFKKSEKIRTFHDFTTKIQNVSRLVKASQKNSASTPSGGWLW